MREALCGRRQVCENIVIPNIRIRADQEEMFEMNWVEYVRRDTEGSDSDTRRRAATELVRALTERFPTEARAQRALRKPWPLPRSVAPSDDHWWRARAAARKAAVLAGGVAGESWVECVRCNTEGIRRDHMPKKQAGLSQGQHLWTPLPYPV